MVSFRIIEGFDVLDDIEEDFLELYGDNSLRIVDICNILNITLSQFQNLRRRLVRRGVITTKRNRGGGRKKQRCYSKKHPRNYFYNRWEHKWNVRYKDKYYACFDSEEECKEFVRLMRMCDWDRNKTEELRNKVIRND